MSDFAYENLPVAIRKKDDVYEIGVVIDGALFVFGGFKAGGFEDDLREAAAAQQQAQQQPQQ